MKAGPRGSERVFMIGLKPEEDPWVRLLVRLLRDPDPVVTELARQALLYMDEAAGEPAAASRA